MGRNGPPDKWASHERSSPSSEQNSFHFPTSWVFFSTIPMVSWICLCDVNMLEGCVPSPNQIVRGLDQPIYYGRRGRGEGRAPLFVSHGWESHKPSHFKALVSPPLLPPPPPPPLWLKNLAASKMPLIRCIKKISFIFKGPEKEIKMP